MDPEPEPDDRYPVSYIKWSGKCYAKILDLIDKYQPSVLVIEETSKGSKNAHSQKILEYIHFRVANYIMESGSPVIYMMTEEWRRIVGCLMTKEEKKQNKTVREAHKEGTKIVKNEKGKRIGIIGKKHVNVRRANELFGPSLREPFKLNDEDKADGILLNYAYHLRQRKKDDVLESETGK